MKTFREAKKKYDQIGDRITELTKEQMKALREMQELCPHENTTVVQDSDFLPDFLQDEEQYKKCRDCGKTFR